MTLYEKFKSVNLWELINTRKPMNIINTIPVDTINSIWLAKYGTLGCTPDFEIMENQSIANHIADIYVDKWNKLLTVFNKDYIDDFKEVYEETNDNTTNSEGINTSTNESNVSAYDDTGYSPDTNNSQNSTTNNTDTSLSKRNYTRTKNLITRIDNNIKYISLLKKDFLYDIMFADVNELLTLKIYNLED